ncbi:MAG: hypothetical protein ACI8YQ_003200 [Polaribacter sp.]|jgi:hypothetical protein
MTYFARTLPRHRICHILIVDFLINSTEPSTWLQKNKRPLSSRASAASQNFIVFRVRYESRNLSPNQKRDWLPTLKYYTKNNFPIFFMETII